jgi:hypothetical protein
MFIMFQFMMFVAIPAAKTTVLLDGDPVIADPGPILDFTSSFMI